MKIALEEAKKGLTTTFPNPAVGCVIVKDNKVISVGYHHKAGDAHAEIDALKKINFDAKDCDIYVTLEPCNHHGKTGPCTEAIIKSGAKNVYISIQDPNPQVDGSGIKRLKNAGIKVETDILRENGEELLKYFSYNIKYSLPYVTLKAALSLNGYINREKGKRTTLTNSKSYNYTLKLRERYQAVLIGINTIIVDNPSFKDMTKFVIGNRKLDKSLNIFKNSDKVYQFTSNKELTSTSYLEVIYFDKKRVDILDILKKVFFLGYGSLFVEGGGEIFSQFIESNLFNELYLYYAPMIISGISRTPFIDNIDNNINLEFIESFNLENDLIVRYKNRNRN